MPPGTGRHVAIIGAGAIGVISAVEAVREGHRVTLIESAEPGGTQAASYGNAGWLGAHSVIPPAGPGLWKTVPSLLMDPLGPLAIRWSHLPKAMPWLARYLWSGWTRAKVEETARALRLLLDDAHVLHNALAEEAGLSGLIQCQGLLHVYPSPAGFEAERLAWEIRRHVGVRWIELEGGDLRRREPDLDPRYGFGVLVEEGGHCRDPGAYVGGLARHAQALGAQVVAAKAQGFDIRGGRLRSVIIDRGEVACDAAVIAAGIHSKALCASLGDRLPLATERGYHVVIEGAEAGPRCAMMADRIGVNWMQGGLRAAGQVEIASVDAAPDWRRADILRDGLTALFPALAPNIRKADVRHWMGHRPSMPDGRPCIGQSRATPDIIYAFGHGHVGLAGSARTGRLVAQLLSGRDPDIPLAAFDPRRYL
jgi:D-amino-acid dehydrogenase